MEKRPVAITVIAWILIVTSALSVFSILAMINNPMSKELMAKSLIPVPLQYLLMVLGLIASVVSGVGMLKGKAWARRLYVIWSVFGLMVGFITSPMRAAMLPGLLFFGIIVFFLFRPACNQYFLKKW